MSMSDSGQSTLTSPCSTHSHVLWSHRSSTVSRSCQQSDHVADNLSITGAKASPWKQVIMLLTSTVLFWTLTVHISGQYLTKDAWLISETTLYASLPRRDLTRDHVSIKKGIPTPYTLFSSSAITILNFEFDTPLLVQAHQWQGKTQLKQVTTAWTSNNVHIQCTLTFVLQTDILLFKKPVT